MNHLSIPDQIANYLASLPPSKRAEMQLLDQMIRNTMPGAQLWFLDGKDANGKVVANPNIGYGALQLKNKSGMGKDFYQIGLSAKTTGISVYVMGLSDKNYLSNNYAERIGKASVTSYCIKFKALSAIDLAVLEELIQNVLLQTGN